MLILLIDEDQFHELISKINANTEMVEATLSGLLDKNIKYNDESESYEVISKMGKYLQKSRLLFPAEVSDQICLKTGGEYDERLGKCVHKNYFKDFAKKTAHHRRH
jgi:hypothetical protein